jgi:hypothetical protein
MARYIREQHGGVTTPGIELPPYIPPTPQELARRRELLDEADQIRTAIGPLGFSSVEIIRHSRETTERGSTE